jgi:hypothetical protein
MKRVLSVCVVLLAASVLPSNEVGVRAQSTPAPPSTPTFDVGLEEVQIPMGDGVRLAADLWRPKGAGDNGRFPVLLEYLPYRKNDGRSSRYDLYAYFVRRGYIVARVDIRGTGSSEGTLIPYEYSEIEQKDGDQVIATPLLTVPHPRMHERAFVLEPLLEIAPEAAIPGIGPARDQLAHCAGQRVERCRG